MVKHEKNSSKNNGHDSLALVLVWVPAIRFFDYQHEEYKTQNMLQML
jgi:hypothetical protein